MATTANVFFGYNYNYDYLNEHTGRVTYAGSTIDASLDRSYEYDQVGRLVISHSGAEARAHVGTGQWGTMDGPYSQGYDFDVWGMSRTSTAGAAKCRVAVPGSRATSTIATPATAGMASPMTRRATLQMILVRTLPRMLPGSRRTLPTVVIR